MEAASRKEAIELLTRHGASVRAVLLDIGMPDMPGDEALPIIRELQPEIRIVLSSGVSDPDARARLSRFGECRFLDKPYTRDRLLAEVLPAMTGKEDTK